MQLLGPQPLGLPPSAAKPAPRDMAWPSAQHGQGVPQHAAHLAELAGTAVALACACALLGRDTHTQDRGLI